MGPLSGKRIIEFAGLGPAPFAAMMLSDLGAEVIRIERMRPQTDSSIPPAGVDSLTEGIMTGGRQSIALDLKSDDGRAIALALVASADALLEGFRPGAMERLGLGPDSCMEINPRLVYVRITGWGQDGPYAQFAGHDLNYIALSGALEPIGRKGEPPVVPLNVIGDFAGGGFLGVTGMLAGLISAAATGKGQIVDTAMVDGSAYLMTMMYELLGRGVWTQERESNPNDGGAHFYGVYETSDQRYISIAAMEPQFYSALLSRLDQNINELPDQWDRDAWPALRAKFAAIFRTRTRDEWCTVLEGLDTCFAPVLSMSEAPAHPHNVARQTFIPWNGAMTPAPAPRFLGTPLARHEVPPSGELSERLLNQIGYSSEQIAGLRARGVVT